MTGRRAEPQPNHGPVELKRVLGRWQLTLIGVSNAIGAGVIVLAGTMAADYAGPASSAAFLIAGIVCFLTALCYAELAAMHPEAGSAYTYAHEALGRPFAWLVGWCLVLGYLVAASTVAVGWSGYFHVLASELGHPFATLLAKAPLEAGADGAVIASGTIVNLPAAAITLVCTLVLVLGIRESARFNSVMVAIKLCAIILFVIVGLFHVDPANWSPFLPPADAAGNYGVGGLLAASVLAFFAYTGFEAISTCVQEARRPESDIPFALIASFWICALLYCLTAIVMTGLVPFALLGDASPMNTSLRLAAPSLAWVSLLIDAMIVVGLPSAVLVSLYSQSRIFAIMSRDGLLPRIFAKIDARFHTPAIGTAIIGVTASIIAGILPLQVLGELVSMGMLFCFAVVCLAVILLRRSNSAATRPFKVPFYPVTPVAGVISCILLVFSLPVATWSRLAIWVAVGVVLYLVYGRKGRGRTQTSLTGDATHPAAPISTP